jgi:putative aldouronate transport system permease protein
MSSALEQFPPLLKKRGGLAARFHQTGRQMRRMRYYYLLLIPTILFFALFHYRPLYGLTIAFKDFQILRGIADSPWVGLKYFDRLFSSPLFYRVFTNTLVISALRILFGFPAPILLALGLNEVRRDWFKKSVQTISYLPYFISWVVLAGMFRELLSPSQGLVNQLLGVFGIAPRHFLADPVLFRPVLIITGVWQSIGWGSVVYLAAIAGVPLEQYEAATIDGAGRFQQVLRITLPSILPVMTIMFLLSLGQILNAGFDQILNLYNPMVYEVADIIDTYVYRVGLLQTDYSFATAVGLFKNVIGFLLVVVVNAVSRRFSGDTLW